MQYVAISKPRKLIDGGCVRDPMSNRNRNILDHFYEEQIKILSKYIVKLEEENAELKRQLEKR